MNSKIIGHCHHVPEEERPSLPQETIDNLCAVDTVKIQEQALKRKAAENKKETKNGLI